MKGLPCTDALRAFLLTVHHRVLCPMTSEPSRGPYRKLSTLLIDFGVRSHSSSAPAAEKNGFKAYTECLYEELLAGKHKLNKFMSGNERSHKELEEKGKLDV